MIKTTNETKAEICDLHVVLTHSGEWPSELTEFKPIESQLDYSKDVDSVLINQPHRDIKNVLILSSKHQPVIDKQTQHKIHGIITNAIQSTKSKVTYLKDTSAIDRELFAADVLTSAYDYKHSVSFSPQVVLVYGCEDENADHQFDKGMKLGGGIKLAMELGNTPANICTPKYLEEEAMMWDAELVNVRIITEETLDVMGAGAFVSVSKGSVERGSMIIIEYNNSPDPNSQPGVIVGKGVTFDTGGISLKPSSKMHEMKFDMLGAAAVLGTMDAIINRRDPIHVVAIVGACENMPSAYATKPGDVVTSLSGQTIEVLNTDAEGRMVMCDCITYAQLNYDPKFIIDIATLTGACAAALGDHASGIFSNNKEFVDQLVADGDDLGERLWELPCWDEYDEQLKSNVADMANIGSPGAGASTAACFLKRYVAPEINWAHIDIAGTAWIGGQSTGVGVKTLLNACLTLT